jgi:hypothetical protein
MLTIVVLADYLAFDFSILSLTEIPPYAVLPPFLCHEQKTAMVVPAKLLDVDCTNT